MSRKGKSTDTKSRFMVLQIRGRNRDQRQRGRRVWCSGATMMTPVYYVSLCANAIAVIQLLHYYAYITEEKTETQKGHTPSKH